jgi:hypothetical protein
VTQSCYDFLRVSEREAVLNSNQVLDDTKVKHVIILVHGIRTNAPWQAILRADLESDETKVELTNYGWFDLFRFLIPIKWIRDIAVRRVWTSIRDIRKLYPNAQMSFLAHSFGTFVVANILRREFDLTAHRIVFCGSVVRYDFPFQEISGRFTSPIINEVGTGDYLPAIAESVTRGYGSAGTYGFRRPRVRDRWHNNISHSSFFSHEFCRKYWVPFFASGSIVEADADFRVPPVYVLLLSRFKLRYLLVCGILVVILLSAISPSDDSSITDRLSEWRDAITSLWEPSSPISADSSMTCRFTEGPKKGETEEVFVIQIMRVGQDCTDRLGSSGVAVPNRPRKE